MVAEATGQQIAEPVTQGKSIRESVADYLAELELKVLCKERRDKTYAATRLALTEFADHTDAKYLRQIKADVSYIRQHIAWTIKSSTTHSGRTACNKYLTLLCWLAWADAVPMVGNGAKAANVHEGRTALC
jgi:hypothetical protein